MPSKSIDKLATLFNAAKEADRYIFKDFTSYQRLAGGDHFNQKLGYRSYGSRSFEGQNTGKKKRLRLTQNHISRFVSVWTSAILDAAPDVDVIPDNANEEKDRKAAELNRSVKAHIVDETDFYSLQEELVKDFIVSGEAIIKLGFNPNEGPLVDGDIVPQLDQQGNPVMEPVLDPEGMPVIDPMTGQMAMRPVLVQQQMPSGRMVLERVDPENLLRDPVARSWNDNRFVIHRHSMERNAVIQLINSIYKDDNTRQQKINSLSEVDKSIRTYESTTQSLSQEEANKTHVREWFWKPSLEYPQGWYTLQTESEVIFESPLPGGIFPFEITNFETNHGTPRGESRIKHLKHVQQEINRCVTKMAEHQVTLGDDKLITFSGSKLNEVNKYEGVRHFNVNGGIAPQILSGRSGNQYENYWIQQIEIFNSIADIPKVEEEKMIGMDPFAIFYLSAKQKMKYAKHASKFERFLIRSWKKILKMHKMFVHSNAVIPVVGKSEAINMDEYKNQEDLGYQIKIKARTEDPDALIASQFEINQFLQYAGGQLDEADIGQLAKHSPFLTKKDFVLRSTLKADRATNMILKLDKGINFPVSPNDDPHYMLQRLDTRTSQADYDFITHRNEDGRVVPTEEIHQLYDYKKGEYIQLVQQIEQAKLRAAKGMIPTTGRPVTVQLHDSEVNEDGKVTYRLMKIPSDSVEWLVEAIQSQGTTLDAIAQQAPQTQTQLLDGLDPVNQAGVDQMGEI